MTSAHQQPRYSLPPPPNVNNDFRLPSLKDLNFQYRPLPSSQQEASPAPTSAGPVEHNSASQENPPRHGQPWGRSNPPSTVPSVMPTHQQHPHQQQTPPLSAGHEAPTPKVEYASKHDSGGYLTPGIPLSAQLTPLPGSVNIGPGTRGDDSPNSHSKRVRTTSGSMTIPRDVRPSHTPYPPQYPPYPSQPPPTSPFHQAAPGPPGPPAPPPHNQMQHHPNAVPSHPGYPGYQYMQPRSHPVHPQHAPHPQQSPHGNPYPSAPPPPAPPSQDPWEHHRQQQHHHQQQQQQQPQHPQPQHTQHPQHHPPPPPHAHVHPQQQQQQHQLQQQHPQHHLQQQQPHQPPQPHHQQMPFAPRTTALVPTNIDTRGAPYVSSDMEKASSTMSEIVKHCTVLYTFASRYAQLQASLPHVQPPQAELAEMTQRATQVVRLLEEFRRMNLPEVERAKLDSAASLNSADDHRPPKRPWEDMSQEGAAGAEPSVFPASYSDKPQSTAEQDMEIIRTKRATSAAGGTSSAGQPKSKYRKRSRATPPGKCHSCNIRETPEWRRGPDGARTLCNACGLHYAKLMRKREKAHGSNGDAPRIDMDTLRASARAADLADKTHTRSSKQQASQSHHMSESTSPVEHTKQPPQHHQGSFQLVPMMTSGSNTSTAPPETGTIQVHQVMPPPNSGPMSVPPPPWATSAPPSVSGGRGYAPDQLQHQSFMRTSQHAKSNHTSPH